MFPIYLLSEIFQNPKKSYYRQINLNVIAIACLTIEKVIGSGSAPCGGDYEDIPSQISTLKLYYIGAVMGTPHLAQVTIVLTF